MGLVDRLCKRLHPGPNGCWEFQGSRSPKGYGRIRRGPANEAMLIAHRAMWEIVFGQIPKGLCVLHSCDNPPCANPAHLFLGTTLDNNADRDAKGRTARGERVGNAKLTREKAKAIRADEQST